jgi:hypothetical protein
LIQLASDNKEIDETYWFRTIDHQPTEIGVENVLANICINFKYGTEDWRTSYIVPLYFFIQFMADKPQKYFLSPMDPHM